MYYTFLVIDNNLKVNSLQKGLFFVLLFRKTRCVNAVGYDALTADPGDVMEGLRGHQRRPQSNCVTVTRVLYRSTG